MGDALIQSFRTQLTAAARWEPGQPPEPVIEALSGVLALELTGDLGRVAASDRDRLRKIGQRALLHVGAAEDEDELEAMRLAAALARDGLRALSGRAPQVQPLAHALPIAPEQMARLLGGGLDGFAAGALAMRIRRDPRARAELDVLLDVETPERDLALAAAEAAPLLDPSVGHALAVHEALGVEAVLFAGEPRRLAIYSLEPIAISLESTSVVTEEVRAGYWLGRIAPAVASIDTILHAGERSARWTIVL